MSTNLMHCLFGNCNAGDIVFRFAEGSDWTFAELQRSGAQMAQALTDLGVERGDRVSFRLQKSPHIIVLSHACFRLGAILHPLNTSYTKAEIEDLLRDATPRLVVTDPSWPEIDTQLAQTITIAALLGLADTSDPMQGICSTEGDLPAALLYTSGTTGKPKGALITHTNLATSARNLAKIWRITRQDCLLHALPLYHAHGLLTSINTMMCSGARIAFLPEFNADYVVNHLPEATVFMGVPTYYNRLLQDQRLADAAKNLRLAISGSGPLSHATADHFHEVTGCRILERYGATETAIVTAVPTGEDGRTGWVGWALPGTDIRVVTTDGEMSQCNAIGQLQTRGPNVFSGYWDAEHKMPPALDKEGWFDTGDVAEIDASGCVRLLGREKELIISGGLNVYPKEIEEVLDAHLGGGISAVFGVPHPDFGEAVMAVTEEADVEEESLKRALKKQLAAYKIPKNIMHIKEIPRNRMGKVLKSALTGQFRDYFEIRSTQRERTRNGSETKRKNCTGDRRQ